MKIDVFPVETAQARLEQIKAFLLLFCSSKSIDPVMHIASLQRGVDRKAARINRYC